MTNVGEATIGVVEIKLIDEAVSLRPFVWHGLVFDVCQAARSMYKDYVFFGSPITTKGLCNYLIKDIIIPFSALSIVI